MSTQLGYMIVSTPCSLEQSRVNVQQQCFEIVLSSAAWRMLIVSLRLNVHGTFPLFKQTIAFILLRPRGQSTNEKLFNDRHFERQLVVSRRGALESRPA